MTTIKYLSTKVPTDTTSSNCSTIQVILKNEPLIKYKSYTYGMINKLQIQIQSDIYI